MSMLEKIGLSTVCLPHGVLIQSPRTKKERKGKKNIKGPEREVDNSEFRIQNSKFRTRNSTTSQTFS
jgi:hypothetical protein